MGSINGWRKQPGKANSYLNLTYQQVDVMWTPFDYRKQAKASKSIPSFLLIYDHLFSSENSKV
jgi:hypothetical protein